MEADDQGDAVKRRPKGRCQEWRQFRHRVHARVEDRIRCGKNTGFGRFPSRHFALNQA